MPDDLVAVPRGEQGTMWLRLAWRTTSFCWMPPIGPTVPTELIVPVPAMVAPPVKAPGVSLS